MGYRGKFVVHDCPRYVKFKHSGLDISLFDRNGHPSMFQLMRKVIDVRNVALWGCCGDRSPLDWRELLTRTSYMPIVVAVDFDMSPDMYNILVPKSPLDATVSLGNVGKASVTTTVELFLQEDSKPLLRHTKKFAFIDLKTRRPVELPEWYRQRFAGKGVLEGVNFRLEKFNQPEETFFRRSEILWSGTDFKDHTNYATYMQLAVDTLHKLIQLRSKQDKTESHPGDEPSPHHAGGRHSESHGVTHTCRSSSHTDRISSSNSDSVSSRDVGSHCDSQQTIVQSWGGHLGVLSNFSREDVAKGLKRAAVSYFKESVEGDLVDTHIWQVPGDGRQLRCCVAGMDGGTLCQISLEYFGQ